MTKPPANNLKRTLALVVMILTTLIIALMIPAFLIAFAMSFDAPGSTTSVSAWFMRAAFLFMPPAIVLTGWILFNNKCYQIILNIALGIGLLILAGSLWSLKEIQTGFKDLDKNTRRTIFVNGVAHTLSSE